MPHTPQCVATTQAYAASVAAFWEAYPLACPACQGAGIVWSHVDPSPAGVSLGAGYLDDVAPCLACEGNEDIPTCALCGQICTAEGKRLCTCPHDASLPQEPECLCWLCEEQETMA